MEVFFKWIKQHLRIKQFYGTSENAVKTQIWIAVSVYVLVAIVDIRIDERNIIARDHVFDPKQVKVFQRPRKAQRIMGEGQPKPNSANA